MSTKKELLDKYSNYYPLNTFNGQTKQDLLIVLSNLITDIYTDLETALPQELDQDENGTELENTWVAGFNNCVNQSKEIIKNKKRL